MTDVLGSLAPMRPRRALALSMALAMALSLIPLQRITAAVHDPVGSGAGMGTRAPLLIDGGARLQAPGVAAGLGKQTPLPSRAASVTPAARQLQVAKLRAPGRPRRSLRLSAYGRLQLEGG